MNRKTICRAAFSQADITPDFQVELIGCMREDNRSRGVLHPLGAQALLFEFGGVRSCLIAIDSLGLTTALSDKLRKMVAGELHADISNVMLSFSHTHSAPAPLSPLNGERYFRLMCARILTCVAEAAENLKSCRAAWAVTETGIGENRREGCTAVDRRLGALKITDSVTGLPLGVVLRVTAHANVLMHENSRISSDYFGVARDRLKAVFDCPVMMIQGAAGNIKPVGVDKILGGNTVDLDPIADILLDSAIRLQFEEKEVTRLQMTERELSYVSDVLSQPEAARIADEAKRLFGIDGSGWLKECETLRNNGVPLQTQKGSVQFLFINEGCICGVPDELFCEIALAASERVHSPYLFLNGYTNGCTGYLPHREEWAKGGYETLYSYLQYYGFHGHVMPFRQDTAERIVNLVCGEWESFYV